MSDVTTDQSEILFRPAPAPAPTATARPTPAKVRPTPAKVRPTPAKVRKVERDCEGEDLMPNCYGTGELGAVRGGR